MIRWQRGDTLVEVALALAILAAVLVGSTTVATRAFRLGTAARETSTAANLIQQQIEQLRNYRDTNIGHWTSTFVPNTASNPFYMASNGTGWIPTGGTHTSGLYTYSITRTATAQIGEYKFNVTATWLPAGTGPTNSLMISTYLVDLDNLRPCDNSEGNCTAAPPIVLSFVAAPSTIQSGHGSILTWSTLNATTITINGVGVGSSGSEPVSPTSTTTYTLVATGLGGSAQRSVTVTVVSPPLPPAINYFYASPQTIGLGGGTNLFWYESGATSVSISAAGQAVGVGASGAYYVHPIVTTYYTLTASGPGGTSYAGAYVYVIQPGYENRPYVNPPYSNWSGDWTAIAGRVTYANGIPIANVTIDACDWNLGAGVYVYATTDADGYYAFPIEWWGGGGSGPNLCVRIAAGSPGTGSPVATYLRSPNVGDGSYECQVPGQDTYNGDGTCNYYSGWDFYNDLYFDFYFPDPVGLNY